MCDCLQINCNRSTGHTLRLSGKVFDTTFKKYKNHVIIDTHAVQYTFRGVWDFIGIDRFSTALRKTKKRELQ